MIVEDQTEVIAFLSRGDAYGLAGSPVERVETHASVVFLVGDRAYKLKRAVRFPYLDYSTTDVRRRFCHAEVRINRRTAPDTYLNVVAVTRDMHGKLRLGGDGIAVEWLVEMARFDEETLFDRLARKGVLDRFAMEDLADRVARFHHDAEPRPGRGGRAMAAKIIDSNARSFRECPSTSLDPDAVADVTQRTWRALSEVETLLEDRRDRGFVRHCHGDLHLRNIFLHHGQATLFDAIEFDPDLADIDVLYDLAFLVMDLGHRALPELASIVLNRYLDNTGDVDGLATLPLFLSLRAAIRSHVQAVAATEQSDPGDAAALDADAANYLNLARRFLMPAPPRLIAIGGLSGSGKSRLARELAPLIGTPPGARVVRTDSTRKRLVGIALGDRLGADGYTQAMNSKTYAAMFEECRRALSAGRSVIADAVFADLRERDAIEQVAIETRLPFQGLWLEASPEVMEERVTWRRRNVSDATAWVVRLQLQYDLGPMHWRRLDTSGPREESLTRARQALEL